MERSAKKNRRIEWSALENRTKTFSYLFLSCYEPFSPTFSSTYNWLNNCLIKLWAKIFRQFITHVRLNILRMWSERKKIEDKHRDHRTVGLITAENFSQGPAIQNGQSLRGNGKAKKTLSPYRHSSWARDYDALGHSEKKHQKRTLIKKASLLMETLFCGKTVREKKRERESEKRRALATP